MSPNKKHSVFSDKFYRKKQLKQQKLHHDQTQDDEALDHLRLTDSKNSQVHSQIN